MAWLAMLPVMNTSAAEAGLVLIKDGSAQGEMILQPEAPFAERFAAMDMRHWLKEMAGVTAARWQY